MSGTYEEKLPSGGKLVVCENCWFIQYYFPGPDLRYNGTFSLVSHFNGTLMIWIINYTLIECDPLILNVAEYFLIKNMSRVTFFCRLTGIDPDEPLGIPSDRPSRWMALGIAMAIQENGMESLDYFAMLKGWDLCRQDVH